MSQTTDRTFETLLRNALRHGVDAPGDHASPEILAAWHERTLGASERRRWEKHLALCGRCQEELAALARIEATEPVRRRWWGPLSWPAFPAVRWAAAGATAVIALSVAVRLAPEAGRVVSDGLAKKKSPMEPAAREVPAAADPETKPATGGPAAEPRRESGLAERRLRAAPDAPAVASMKTAPAAAPPPFEKKEAERPDARSADEVAALGNESGSFRDQTAERDVAEERTAVGAVDETIGAAAAATPERTIVVASPERSNLWRLADGGRIEHSTDGGVRWTVLETGVETDLLAGMAPLERVCWVIGRDGTILRTTDATSWEKVSSPTEADLVHVWAVDADEATVATAPGREYRTEDGGGTWQELPPSPDS